MTYDEEARPEASVVLSGVREAPGRTAGRGVQTAGAAQRLETQNLAVAATAPHDPGGDVAQAALQGLLAPRKTLPPALFYDEEGCRLFYKITKLPEYYLTRTEFQLLQTIAPEVAAQLPAGATLVEYGASDETKAEMLLSQTARTGSAAGESIFSRYIPIDVAGPELRAMRERLAQRRPDLSVIPVTADFMRPITLPDRGGDPDRDAAIMGFFPGSTIGNLEPDPAIGFLHRARVSLGFGAHFLLGFDICRDPGRLIPAYDDPAGVTAAFNRNLLVRLNREAGATFDPGSFAHRAIWNPAESRIEMHLVSRAPQTVLVAGQPIRFARDETIHTENSYKYTPERMHDMAAAAGWTVTKKWSDSNDLFTLWLLK
jgi:dimethylhistidine N-methyltransferase